MDRSRGAKIITFAKEIISLPKNMVTSATQKNAYRNMIGHIVKATTLTNYVFAKPPIEYVIRFLSLFSRNNSGVPIVTEEEALEEIELTKLYDPFE